MLRLPYGDAQCYYQSNIWSGTHQRLLPARIFYLPSNFTGNRIRLLAWAHTTWMTPTFTVVKKSNLVLWPICDKSFSWCTHVLTCRHQHLSISAYLFRVCNLGVSVNYRTSVIHCMSCVLLPQPATRCYTYTNDPVPVFFGSGYSILAHTHHPPPLAAWVQTRRSTPPPWYLLNETLFI